MNQRLIGLIRKETKQILRDPSSLAIAFLLPVILLLLFGYGVSLNARHIPIALVADAPDAHSAALFSHFDHSESFTPQIAPNLAVAEQWLLDRRVDAIVHLPSDFSRRLVAASGEAPAPVQLIVNGVDANQARLIEAYVQATWSLWLNATLAEQGRTLNPPITLIPRIWFNPELRSRDYLVPGLIAVIMTLIGALLTALVMAREWERGTLEAMMVTPMQINELILGKLLPYFVLGMGGMALSVAMARWLFAVPFLGSWWLLVLSSAVFLLAALGMGLLISVTARNQFIASLISIIVTFLPAFMLSGFIFDIGSMPSWLQALTHLVAARYFVTLLHTLFLAGDIPSIIWPNLLALAALALVFLAASRRKIRKSLD
ncbi:ABC transporter permease [Halothiobacillus sp. DCM-1]|uniref:ABC transporter permease n=1 Tax=Halothiobacillus sp. DCM-1 TaxID=3112558 RepID=UPI0032526D0F